MFIKLIKVTIKVAHVKKLKALCHGILQIFGPNYPK